MSIFKSGKESQKVRKTNKVICDEGWVESRVCFGGWEITLTFWLEFVASESVLPSQNLVEDHAEGVDVSLWCSTNRVGLVVQQFRRLP